MTPLTERRMVPLTEAEIRSAAGGVRVFEGYAAVFNEWATIGQSFREQIEPKAFNRTLKNNADVRMLVNHDGLPLARTKSGTLRLSTDERGLHVQADLDERQAVANDLSVAVERGDVDSMSFAFRTISDEWDDEPEDEGLPKRSLRELNLNDGDVSPVTYPAYSGTSAGIRADQTLAEIRSILASRGREMPVSLDERIERDFASALSLIANTSPEGDFDPDQLRAAIETLEAMRPALTTSTEPGHALDSDLVRSRNANRKRLLALVS